MFAKPIKFLLIWLFLTACSSGNDEIFSEATLPTIIEFSSTLTPAAVIEGSLDLGTASASLSLNSDNGVITSLHVDPQGLAAVSVQLFQGFAGELGTEITELTENNEGFWTLSDYTLSAEELSSLKQGGVYLEIATTSQTSALRGQLLTNNLSVMLTLLSGAQEVPSVTSVATGVGAITMNTSTGSVVFHVTTVGADDATAAHVHRGFAGTNGDVLIGLMQDVDNMAHWSATETLDNDGIAALNAGELYFNIHSPANPSGEIRGQIAPEGIAVIFSSLSGSQEVPSVTSAASGVGATTMNTSTGSITFHVTTIGADNAIAAHVHRGFAGTNGGVLIGLMQDVDNMAHWLATAAFGSDGIEALNAGELYFNVHSPANPTGEIRGQITQ